MRKLFVLTVLFALLINGFVSFVCAEDKDCKELSGWLIYPEKENSPVVQEIDCGEEKLFRIVDYSGKTIASMPVPRLPKGYELNHGECQLDGVIRNDIVAIVRHSSEKEISYDVLNAWVADPETKSFRPISVKGLSCFNTGYGI